MARQFWLVKSEPYKYSFTQLVHDKRTVWDGVRNYEARNNLRAMKEGDLLLFYHSNEEKAVVGVAEVGKEAYPDPTSPGEDWSVVEVLPVVALKSPVELETIRSDAALVDIALLKRSRLSVVPVSKEHFEHLLLLGKTRLPRSKGGEGSPDETRKNKKKA